MSLVNPHFFSAILDGISHRFVLILECESIQGTDISDSQNPPRFSVGAINATRDPRLSTFKHLMEVGVDKWLMVHQFIYITHQNTDENGWQYRSQWSNGIVPGPRDEPWVSLPTVNSRVRRRIWMSTIVPRDYLIPAKRLLTENFRVDSGVIKMEGDLLRYEKGGLTKSSWQKRHVVLLHNRLEFYSGNSKKGEVNLSDCEVKMLFENQCPGRDYAFSIRNPIGSVGILLDASTKDNRRNWVLAIQYQLAINANDLNFPPFEYGPPTGEDPDNRVLLCGDLLLRSKNNAEWLPRHFQLLPREIVCFDGEEEKGRVFVEGASIFGDEKNLNFMIKSASGIAFNLNTDSPESKNLWLLGVRRQVQALENQKLKAKTSPKIEQSDESIPVANRISQFYDDNWTAPAVDGEDEDYLNRVFNASIMNNPNHFEFSIDLGIFPSRLSSSSMEMSNQSASGLNNSPHNSISSKELVPANYNRNSSNNNMDQASPNGSRHNSLSLSGGSGRLTKKPSFRQSIGSNISTQSDEAASGLMASSSQKQQQFSSQYQQQHMMTNQSSTMQTFSSSKTASSFQQQQVQQSSSTFSTTSSSRSEAITSQSQSHIQTHSQSERNSFSNGLSKMKSIKSTKSLLNLNEPQVKLLDPKRVMINPKFILNVLKGVTHRFVLVLESETRVPDPGSKADFPELEHPPRFSVGGPRASKDPRTVPVSQLIEISNKNPEIQLPNGWFMLHSYIYIAQHNTDDYGWQYRSDWSNGVVTGKDEAWSDVCTDDKFVRRRLWMTTVVKKDDYLNAKRLVCQNLKDTKGDVILQGNLYKYHSEFGSQANSWQRRKVMLFHDHIEFYIGNEKKGEESLQDCRIEMLTPSQCSGRKNAFVVRNSSHSINILFDADTKESRLQWVKAINYQLALLCPDLNFAPFEFGPPIGDIPEHRVLFCGDLEKLHNHPNEPNKVESWSLFTFQLKPLELLYYQRDILCGRLFIAHAEIKTRAADEEFAIQFSSGLLLTLRAESNETKLAWVRAIKKQIQAIDRDHEYNQNKPIVEKSNDTLTPQAKKERYYDEFWKAPEINEQAEKDFLELIRRNRQELREFSNEADGSLNSSPKNKIGSPRSSFKSKSNESLLDNKGNQPEVYLKYGGDYLGDPKDTPQFKFISFEAMPKINSTKTHKSLMAKYLTPEIFRALKDKKTRNGITLSNIIMNGVVNPGVQNPIGLTAGDAASYHVFEALFQPVVQEIHHYDMAAQDHPTNLDPASISFPPEHKHIFDDRVSFIRINASRNLKGYPFMVGINDKERSDLEHILRKMFAKFSGDLFGEYFKYISMNQDQKDFFEECTSIFHIPIESHIWTGTGDGSGRSWPMNRGVFVNTARSTYIWVNNRDHIQMVLTDSGGDVFRLFVQFCILHQAIQDIGVKDGHDFAWDEHLGFVTASPYVLGTAMTLSCLVHLPGFNVLMESSSPTDKELLQEVCDIYGLTSSGSQGMHTPSNDSLFDISIRPCLGKSEVEVVQAMIDGILMLIELDMALEEKGTAAIIDIRRVLVRNSPKKSRGSGSSGRGNIPPMSLMIPDQETNGLTPMRSLSNPGSRLTSPLASASRLMSPKGILRDDNQHPPSENVSSNSPMPPPTYQDTIGASNYLSGHSSIVPTPTHTDEHESFATGGPSPIQVVHGQQEGQGKPPSDSTSNDQLSPQNKQSLQQQQLVIRDDRMGDQMQTKTSVEPESNPKDLALSQIQTLDGSELDQVVQQSQQQVSSSTSTNSQTQSQKSSLFSSLNDFVSNNPNAMQLSSSSQQSQHQVQSLTQQQSVSMTTHTTSSFKSSTLNSSQINSEKMHVAGIGGPSEALTGNVGSNSPKNNNAAPQWSSSVSNIQNSINKALQQQQHQTATTTTTSSIQRQSSTTTSSKITSSTSVSSSKKLDQAQVVSEAYMASNLPQIEQKQQDENTQHQPQEVQLPLGAADRAPEDDQSIGNSDNGSASASVSSQPRLQRNTSSNIVGPRVKKIEQELMEKQSSAKLSSPSKKSNKVPTSLADPRSPR